MRRILVGLVRKVMAARTPPPSGGESPYGLPWPHRAPCFPAPAEAPKSAQSWFNRASFSFSRTTSRLPLCLDTERPARINETALLPDIPKPHHASFQLPFAFQATRLLTLSSNLLRNPTPHPNHRCLRPLQQPRLRRTSDISPGLLSGRVPQNLSPRMRMHKASTTTSRRAREW
jgi:hypothetical protein